MTTEVFISYFICMLWLCDEGRIIFHFESHQLSRVQYEVFHRTDVDFLCLLCHYERVFFFFSWNKTFCQEGGVKNTVFLPDPVILLTILSHGMNNLVRH